MSNLGVEIRLRVNGTILVMVKIDFRELETLCLVCYSKIMNNENLIEKPLLERFLRYVKIHTTSNSQNADSGVQPSTEVQRNFADILKQELKDLGIQDVHVTKHAYVCARIPASKGCENKPSVGFLAHMDTVEGVSGLNVTPQVIENYEGQDIILNDGIILSPKNDTFLKESIGETIITTDGTTLLGADDKAGIAEIMTAIDIIVQESVDHGQIEIIFSPDEETGHGMDNVPLDWIQSKFCYTLDGGHIGELEYECFTAFKSEIEFTGISQHTGTARPNMINAITMAANFINLLPAHESPETTDEYQGFYAPMKIEGQIEDATVVLFLRDFDDSIMQRRLQTVEVLAKAIETKYFGSTVKVTHTKQYQNMKKKLNEYPEVMDVLLKSAKECNIIATSKPIRGGTDGSRLTEMGIPTPNIFTGGHNFHSRSEWASLNQMTKAVTLILQLVKNL